MGVQVGVHSQPSQVARIGSATPILDTLHFSAITPRRTTPLGIDHLVERPLTPFVGQSNIWADSHCFTVMRIADPARRGRAGVRTAGRTQLLKDPGDPVA